jgi:peptide/nickel transport system substrate-binding protein
MRPSQPRRAAAVLATLAVLGGALLAAGVGPVAAADPVTLTVGTTQDLDSSNPFNTELVVGYEAFELTYSLLVDFDKDAHPAPGFADSWVRTADRVTFKIGAGRKWSDGQPATSDDVCFSWGLAIAAHKDNGAYIGSGYLDPGLSDAGVTKVECPDPTTFIAYTTDPSDRIFQIYMPILPKHVWGKDDYKKIASEKFDAPLVGTGPYTLAEWKTGNFARFVRNPNFWGKQGFEDEVVLRFFPDNGDTMLQALKTGELDYVHGVNADQFKQLQADTATYTTVAGAANGWTQLAFNTYGTGTGKTIPNGGASTKALQDAAFRDALGYAVDKQALVDKVLGGFGDLGDTVVPPVLTDYHVTPDKPRTFNIDTAKQKLDAAGYKLDANGKRLDKEGKPIVLSLVYPNTDDNYKKVAAFVKDWYGQLGIEVNAQSYDSDTLTSLLLPPEADPPGTAKYDIELWGWSGSPDPNGLLYVFLCNQIGTSSDSNYCNKTYDSLYAKESKEGGDQRKATLAQMQNLIYDEAPYDVLYYDANLDVYRNDRFAGWQNMPANGTPFFTYGILDYTLLTDATAVPTPGPTDNATVAPGGSAAPTTAGSSAVPSNNTASSGTTTTIAIVVALVILAAAGLWWFSRRRKATASVEDE